MANAGVKILIVDDQASNRQLLKVVLAQAGEGYVFVEADSGEAALQAVEQDEPDIILLDVMMPGMDGFDVCQNLKRQEKYRGIPVLFITTRDKTEDMVKCFSSGAVDYITKPINGEEVKSRVKIHVNIRKAEKVLLDNEAKYRAMATYSADWESWVGVDGKISWVNPAVEKITGYTVEDCLGMADFPLPMVAPEDAALIQTGFQEAVQGIRGEGLQFRIACKDGSRRWGFMSWQPIFDRNGVLQGHRSSVRDITEQKNAESSMGTMKRQLVQADKLATLGEMATSLAHEINQPLGGIALTATYLRKVMAKKVMTDDKLQIAIQDIEASIARMTKTINHLRVYARREEPPAFFPVDVPGTIDAALSLMGEQLRIHGIELVPAFDPDLPKVLGDPYQLEQVWINFMSNARDSMDEKERLIKEGKLDLAGYQKKLHMAVSWHKESGMIQVSFSDNGMGAGEEDIKRAFEAFFTTKGEGKGTGLGLSISQGIIEKHQGRIAMEGRKGERAVLKVYLPVAVIEGS